MTPQLPLNYPPITPRLPLDYPSDCPPIDPRLPPDCPSIAPRIISSGRWADVESLTAPADGSPSWTDAESLTIHPDGSVLVSFESVDRVLRYGGGLQNGSFLGIPTPPAGGGWADALAICEHGNDGNMGAEAITLLDEGKKLLFICEASLDQVSTKPQPSLNQVSTKSQPSLNQVSTKSQPNLNQASAKSQSPIFPTHATRPFLRTHPPASLSESPGVGRAQRV